MDRLTAMSRVSVSRTWKECTAPAPRPERRKTNACRKGGQMSNNLLLNPHPVVTSTTSSGQHARDPSVPSIGSSNPQKLLFVLSFTDHMHPRPSRLQKQTTDASKLTVLPTGATTSSFDDRACMLAGCGLRPAPSPGLGLGERAFSVRGPAWSARFSPNFFLNVASL